MIVRYCAHCDTEFQPHIERCSDCGGELQDVAPEDESEDLEDAAARPEPEADTLPPGEYHVILRDISAEVAENVGKALGAAKIPFKLGVGPSYRLELSVRSDDAAAVRARLDEAGLVSAPSDSETAVGEVGGPCPACGMELPAGLLECSGCGLVLGGDPLACERCGAELEFAGEQCPRCSRG
jgi:hypothetical protein